MSGNRESGSKPKKDMALVLACIKALNHFTHTKRKVMSEDKEHKTRKCLCYNCLLIEVHVSDYYVGKYRSSVSRIQFLCFLTLM